MITVLLIGPPALVCIAQIARLVLLMSGRWKGPILSAWTRYQPEEAQFDPLPALTLWAGLLTTIIGMAAVNASSVEAPLYAIGLLLLALARVLHSWHGRARMRAALGLPRWMRALEARSTREERRHLGWMWQRLPAATRQHFNEDDRAFAMWTDLVMLTTIQQTVYDPQIEHVMQTELYEPRRDREAAAVLRPKSPRAHVAAGLLALGSKLPSASAQRADAARGAPAQHAAAGHERRHGA
jgi:hypothetical protein